jgi:ABC-type multidrug transport system ATPase subunit
MLKIENLTKRHTKEIGIFNIDFSVSSGRIVAFLGPNGAGKSTLFNILGGISEADEGKCLFTGIPLSALNICDVGFLPENMYIPETMTPVQMLHFMNTMKELKATEVDISDLLDRFGIRAYQNKRIRHLSQGMRKRVALVCALLGHPKLLILDEPLNALDIQSVIQLKREISALKSEGAVVLLSSHILDFLDNTADEIVFLKNGRIIDICHNNEDNVEKIYIKHFMVKES